MSPGDLNLEQLNLANERVNRWNSAFQSSPPPSYSFPPPPPPRRDLSPVHERLENRRSRSRSRSRSPSDTRKYFKPIIQPMSISAPIATEVEQGFRIQSKAVPRPKAVSTGPEHRSALDDMMKTIGRIGEGARKKDD